MFGFGNLIEILKKSPKKIVFTEGTDARILEAGVLSRSVHLIRIAYQDRMKEVAGQKTG